jgi:hypothetical protein
MELWRLGRKGKIRLVAAISHPLTRLALLLRGDEVDNLRFRLHLPNDLADLFLRQLGLGEPDAVDRASHLQRSINQLGLVGAKKVGDVIRGRLGAKRTTA